MPNHLAGETSPYLFQHADNPVDWYPWGEEALNKATTENKPILLSIGYSACHWCHVMAHENFENPNIADLMNDGFINIKVDREERPDLDSIYMQAVQAITGSGGWPLTVFLTPDREPFFGGTYFPPEDRQGLPGFPRVLHTVAEAYRNRHSDIREAARQIMGVLTSHRVNTEGGAPLAADIMKQARTILERDFDWENGGFGWAPKFPQPMALEFLLRYSRQSGDKTALEMVETTLEKIAQGGIYDQLGGGFHRYATDSKWLIPHFEKMLYDNALLSRVYLHAYLLTGKQLYRLVVEQTLDYILRDMTAPEGGFYSTQDADSEGSEGKYYLWTPADIIEVVGDGVGQSFMDYYGVTEEGNFDGSNILNLLDQSKPEVPDDFEQVKKTLLARREQRVKPGCDEKVLASWNGLMLSSLAEAASVLGRKDYLNAAAANGSFLRGRMMVNGGLRHIFKDGEAKIEGYLDDYAGIIEGFLMLHVATLRGEWLRQAISLTNTMIEKFWDESAGTFFDATAGTPDLIVRPRTTIDGATPSASSVATLILLKLGRLTDDTRFEQLAVKSLQSVRDLLADNPLGFGNWLCALDFHLSESWQAAFIGPASNRRMSEFLHTICKTWLPNIVVAALDLNDSSRFAELKLFQGKEMIDNHPTAYICRHQSCQAPVTDPVSLKKQLEGK
ncbi:MAG: thioredoxin domain-containing protein [Dehalococcoidales bacterium]|nr:thioredoxin domain-containing protein [Dehalococcoidales bacterium]